MNQLKKLQYTFQENVLELSQSDSNAWISAEGRATTEMQLSIYQHAYQARLIEVLTNDYPTLLIAIGEEYFMQLATNYIHSHPSKFFSLRDFGAAFANFIARLIQQKTTWQEMPWLYELATFEWRLGQTFDAADDPIFTIQDMATVAPEALPELTFKLHSSVQRLDFEWNVVEIWQALTAEIPTEVTAIKGSSSAWLIWRENLSTRFRSMETDEQVAFATLTQGGSFADICESMTNIINEDKIPMHAATLLKSWISQSLISEAQ